MLLGDPLYGTANAYVRLGQPQTATVSARRCFAACVCGGSFSATACSVQLLVSTCLSPLAYVHLQLEHIYNRSHTNGGSKMVALKRCPRAPALKPAAALFRYKLSTSK